MASNASGAARWAQWLIILFQLVAKIAAYAMNLLFNLTLLLTESSPINAAAIPRSDETIALTSATEEVGESSHDEGDSEAFSSPLNDRVMTWWRTSHVELRRKEAASRGHRRETRNFVLDRHHSGGRLPTVASGEALDCAAFSADLCRTNAATVRSSPSCSESLIDLSSDAAADALLDAPSSSRHSAAGPHPRLPMRGTEEQNSVENRQRRRKGCGSPLGVLDIDSVGASSSAESRSPESGGEADTNTLRQNDRATKELSSDPLVPSGDEGEQLDWRHSSDEEPLFF